MTAAKLFLLSAILFHYTIVCGAGGKQTKVSAADQKQTKVAAKEQKKLIEKLSILVIAPGLFFAKSHLSFAASVVKILIEKHNVHFVIVGRNEIESKTFFFMEHPNLKIDYYAPKDAGLRTTFMTPTGNTSLMEGKMIFYKVFLEMIQTNFLKGEKFDVGIYEESNVNKHATAVLHHLGIKNIVAISASSLRAQPLNDMTDLDNKTNLGLLDKYKDASIPLVFSDSKTFGAHLKHTEQERLKRKKDIQVAYDNELTNFYNFLKADQEFKSAGFPGYVEMYKKIRFQWVNTQPQLEWDDGKILAGAKKVGYIAGIHMNKQPLRLEKAEAALHAKMVKLGENVKIVLIAFGTMFDTIASMTVNDEDSEQFKAILKVIEESSRENPQKHLFVWKLTENDTRIETLNKLPNVYASHWVNQEALLASGKVAAFISHCGKNTQIEVVYYSVPVICVPPPPYVDWIFCSEVLAKKQVAKILQYVKTTGTDSDAFTASSIKKAVNEVANLNQVAVVGEKFKNQIASKSPSVVILGDMEIIKKELNAAITAS